MTFNKRLITALAMAAVMTACGTASVDASATESSTSAATVAASESSPQYQLSGALLRAFNKAGGEQVMGPVITNRATIVVNRESTYHQHTAKGTRYGTLISSTRLGGRSWLSPAIPTTTSINNERDALSRYGFKPVLYRSARLTNASQGYKQIMATMLQDGLIIDLRDENAARKYPDPSLPGVKRVRIHVPHYAKYNLYVTDSYHRQQFGKAITAFANEPDPVWVHCTMGQDRTGWFVAMVMFAGGATEKQVYEEFNRTPDPPTWKLTLGLKTIKQKYGTVDNYLRTGLGLSQTTLDKINAKKVSAP